MENEFFEPEVTESDNSMSDTNTVKATKKPIAKQIVFTTVSLLLCILATFAWFNDQSVAKGKYMDFNFTDGNTAISSSDIDVEVYVEMTDGQDDYVLIEEDSIINFDNFVPGSSKRFKAVIRNGDSVPMSISMFFTDVECENHDLGNKINVGISGYTGFTEKYPAPKTFDTTLAQEMLGKDGTYQNNCKVLETVEIPPDNEDNPVEVYFYVQFARDAGIEYIGQTFKIGRFVFMAS